MDEKMKNWINATKRAQQLEIVNKINKLQKDLHNGKISTTGFYIEIITMKEDLENGIIPNNTQ